MSNRNLDRFRAGVEASAIATGYPITRDLIARTADLWLDFMESDPSSFWTWLRAQGSFPHRDFRQLEPAREGTETAN